LTKGRGHLKSELRNSVGNKTISWVESMAANEMDYLKGKQKSFLQAVVDI
jgi:hypothetical protein